MSHRTTFDAMKSRKIRLEQIHDTVKNIFETWS